MLARGLHARTPIHQQTTKNGDNQGYLPRVSQSLSLVLVDSHK